MRARIFPLIAVVATAAAFGVASATAAVSVGHSGWEWGNPAPQGQTILSVDFSGSNGYAAGSFGTVLRTEDGGETWRDSPTGLTTALRRVRIIDEDSVIVAGDCALRRSDDGGETFRRLPWTATDARCGSSIADVDFPDDQTGYLLLDDGSVLSTADGGSSWSRDTSVPTVTGALPLPPTRISFQSAGTGIAVSRSGRIYRTTDSASSWTTVHAGTTPLTGLDFADVLIGYAVGPTGTVLKTVDGGLTWAPPSLPGVPLSDIVCGTPLACAATTVGGNVLLRTSNGAATWSAVTPASDPVLAVGFSSPTSIVAVGEDGTTVVSGDTGATWRPIGKRLDTPFSRVRALSPSVSYAVGPRGALARSDDGGATWSAVGVSTAEDVIDVSFTDATTGYALDQQGALLLTDNGGQSWQVLDTGTASRPQAVLALNKGIVLLVGPKGVRRSIDGGDFFDRVRGRLLNRSKLFNVDRGGSSVFVYGSKNILVSTTKGRTWKKVRLPRKTLIQAVDFVSARVGFALGQDGQVFKTRNRGERWLDLSGVGNDDATGLSFSNSARGYLTLKRFDSEPYGYVLRTTDGGRTWRPQLVGTDEPSPDGIVATGSSTALLLADSRALLFTRSGGDRGDTSKVTLRTKRRKVRRRTRVRVTGRVSGASGGAQVVVSRRERGERSWVSQTATVASNGSFTTSWKLTKTAAFVAQWAGDPDSAGDGSPPLVVRTKRR